MAPGQPSATGFDPFERGLVLCGVRGCAEVLARRDRALVCPRGHAFDFARSGYANLLQPQDRRARAPGDAPEVVRARARWLERGHGNALLAALRASSCFARLQPGSAVLDVGCGEGWFLRELVGERALACVGVDLSVSALATAARVFPDAAWIAANADRSLPCASGTFDLLLALHARLNPAEFRRVLRSDGALLLALPAADDLIELRAAVLGEGREIERAERALRELEGRFRLQGRKRVAEQARLSRAEIEDALAATYRGARRQERERLGELSGLQVTLATELLELAPC